MSHFEIKNLSFSFPLSKNPALSDINMSVNEGEYVVICGKSGSGKTTLMRHFKSVMTPYGDRMGQILFNGVALEDVTQREQSSSIGYVMQDPDSQIVTDKVWHELAFGLESLGTDQRTMRLRVAEMANYFGIQTWFHKKVNDLSGGQKQLLNLASVMAMQPSVLILDEPTSQLDPIAAADFLNTIKKINLELGTTIIISEHRLEDVLPCSDRVIVLEKGKIIADDTPINIGKQLYKEKNDMVAALPSPMQIYFATGSHLSCPLNVRDGRNWISKYLGDKSPRVNKLQDEPYYCETDKPVLELKDVWFRYSKETEDVLRGVNIKIPQGSLYAVVGGNGTGKSTMLKAICEICKPYRGKISINQKNINKYKGSELFDHCLAMLPQDPQALFVKKTVKLDLEEMLSDKGMTDKQRDSMINTVVSDCEIEELLSSHPYDLSGGEQQRAALAKVLLCQPKILLLDEPTKGIDNFFKTKLASIIQRLKAKNVTVIMVSHDVEFCAKYADLVSLFFDGSVITTNTPKRFFSENSFYTTSANRMSRHVFKNAVTTEDVITLCQQNKA